MVIWVNPIELAIFGFFVSFFVFDSLLIILGEEDSIRYKERERDSVRVVCVCQQLHSVCEEQ